MTTEQAKRRVFLSFQYEDRKYCDLMSAWAANENDDFDFYNERLNVAIDSTNADYIKEKIRPKIRRASVLVCVIGATTSSSRWVNWEVEYAKSQDKGLVGVQLEEDSKRPSQIANSGAIFVAYRKEDILRAIDWAATSRERSKDWHLK